MGNIFGCEGFPWHFSEHVIDDQPQQVTRGVISRDTQIYDIQCGKCLKPVSEILTYFNWARGPVTMLNSPVNEIVSR